MSTVETEPWRGLEEIRPALETFLARRCRDQNDADDIIQETLMRAARYRGSLTDNGRLGAWATRIAGNVLTDRRRNEQPVGGEELLDLLPDPRAAVEDQVGEPELRCGPWILERRAALACLDGARAGLSAQDRRVLDAYYTRGQSCGTISLEHDIPRHLVKVRLFRARQRLFRAFRQRASRVAQGTRGLGGSGVKGLCALALLALGLPHESPAPRFAGVETELDGETPTEPPRLASVELQVAHAHAKRRELWGTTGDERRSRRRAAIAAYRAIPRWFPEDVRAASLGWFRAGELARGGGELAEALDDFERAAAVDPRGELGLRARLESAHTLRRLTRTDEALTTYERVRADRRSPPELRDDATYWVGRLAHAEGRVDDALRLWRALAEGAHDPFDRVRAWDEIAVHFVAAGELGRAAQELQTCRESVASIAREETVRGARMRRALERMRGVAVLRRAVAEEFRKESDDRHP